MDLFHAATYRRQIVLRETGQFINRLNKNVKISKINKAIQSNK